MQTSPARCFLTILAALGLSACGLGADTGVPADAADGADGSDGADGGDGDDGSALVYTEHCGVVSSDETWRQDDNPHLIACSLQVDGGHLTIEAGVEIYVREGFGLTVGELGQASRLSIDGTPSNPVRFRPEADDGLPGSWLGIRLAEDTAEASIHNTVLVNGGKTTNGALSMVLVGDVTVDVQGLEVQGSAGCGVELRSGAGLAEGSRDIHVADTLGPPACARASNAHTLPGLDLGSSYASEAEPYIEISGGELETSVTWENLGLPYGVRDTFVVGRPLDPAVLTIGPGTTVAFDQNQGLELSTDGDASGLIALGEEGNPVTFTGLGSQEPGSWVGIIARRGTDPAQFILRHTRVEYAGSRNSSILIEDTELLADHLTVFGSYSNGLLFNRTGAFRRDSLVVQSMGHNGAPLTVDARAVASIPSEGLLLDSEDDTYDLIYVTGNSAVRSSGTWKNLGMRYFITGEVDVSGSSDAPAILTIESGTELLFADNGDKLSIGQEGAAGLILGGMDCATTTADPVVLRGGRSSAAGAWNGLHLFYDYDDAASCLGNFVVDGSGGAGAVRLTGSPSQPQVATLTRATLRNLPDSTCPAWANNNGTFTIVDSETDHTLGWNPTGSCAVPEL